MKLKKIVISLKEDNLHLKKTYGKSIKNYL